MNSFEQKLFKLFQDKGLIPADAAREIAENLKNIDGSLEGVIAKSLKIDPADILSAKGEVSGLPTFNLADEKDITQGLLREISEEAAQQYKIVPLQKSGKKLKVGILNPENYSAREAIRFIALGTDVIPEIHVITEGTFRKILGRYRTFRGQIEEALTELEKELKEPEQIQRKPIASSDIIREAPVTKVVAVILKHAVEGKASDIHIEKGAEHTHVRFRVYGKLYTSLLLPSRIHSAVISRIKILASLRLDETRIPQDGRFSAEVSGRNIDFRVSTLPTVSGEKAVLRVLDPYGAISELSDLGLVGSSLEKLKKAIGMPFGMILVSGPTGSGKSTTLYASLLSLDRKIFNVVSLEDPVEYHIEGVNQSQIRPEIGYTFAVGLRHILRQDPDVIMVGEIRDTETAKLATHAALTGHLVFSSIHTKDTVGVIPRLIDMEVDQFLIPSVLSLAVAQRLVRKLCPNCKVAYAVPRRVSEIISRELGLMRPEELQYFKLKPQSKYQLWKSPGCDKCSRKGTLGRIGIFEALVVTEELSEIIYKNPNEITIKNEAKRQGMITLKQDAIIKALQGIVSIEEALRVSED